MTNKEGNVGIDVDEESCDTRLAAMLAVQLVRQVLDEAYVIANAASETDQPWRCLSMVKNISSANIAIHDEENSYAAYKGDCEDNVSDHDNDAVPNAVVTSTPQKITGEIIKVKIDANIIGQGDEGIDMQDSDLSNSTATFINHLFDMSDVERVIICDDNEFIPRNIEPSNFSPLQDITKMMESYVNAALSMAFVTETQDTEMHVTRESSRSTDYSGYSFLSDAFNPEDMGKDMQLIVNEALARIMAANNAVTVEKVVELEEVPDIEEESEKNDDIEEEIEKHAFNPEDMGQDMQLIVNEALARMMAANNAVTVEKVVELEEVPDIEEESEKNDDIEEEIEKHAFNPEDMGQDMQLIVNEALARMMAANNAVTVEKVVELEEVPDIEEESEKNDDIEEEIEKQDSAFYENAYLTLNRDDEQCSEEEGPVLLDPKGLAMQEVELMAANTSDDESPSDAEKKCNEMAATSAVSAVSRKSLVHRCRSQGARLLACLRGWWRRKTPGKRKDARMSGSIRGICPLSPDARRRAASMLDQRHLRSPSPNRSVVWKFNTVNEALVNSSRWKEYTFDVKPDECGEY